LGAASSNFHEQERRMTITVVTIVSCFTITQLPSAMVFLYEKLISDAKTETFATLSCISNFLVLTGKMLNVVLFCLTSVTFRRKFFATVSLWLRKFTCQYSNYVRQRSTLNRSITQKSSLFSTTSFRIQKCPGLSAQAGSLIQPDEQKLVATDFITENHEILADHVQKLHTSL
uniref:G_PROTEIN_RECEP_F1_2 domain-containing protein n=1 Tax=Gongylonema pulchrum TaxID=637853 RepID=A0A183CZE0_9BILA